MELTLDQKKAISIIKKYLNVDDNPTWTNEYIMENYDFVVDEIIEQSNNIKSIKSIGIKSKTEGEQTVEFTEGVEAWSITENIKNLLPVPFVKMYY